MEKTKKQQVKDLVNSGDLKGALKIAKGFKIEFNESEQEILQIAYECLTGKESFYKQIGINIDRMKSEAQDILNRYASNNEPTINEKIISILGKNQKAPLQFEGASHEEAYGLYTHKGEIFCLKGGYDVNFDWLSSKEKDHLLEMIENKKYTINKSLQ